MSLSHCRIPCYEPQPNREYDYLRLTTVWLQISGGRMYIRRLFQTIPLHLGSFGNYIGGHRRFSTCLILVMITSKGCIKIARPLRNCCTTICIYSKVYWIPIFPNYCTPIACTVQTFYSCTSNTIIDNNINHNNNNNNNNKNNNINNK